MRSLCSQKALFNWGLSMVPKAYFKSLFIAQQGNAKEKTEIE